MEEPRNNFLTRAPTLPANEALHVNPKRKFDVQLDRPLFAGRMKIRNNTRTGAPKNNSDGTPSYGEVVLTQGIVKESFLEQNKLTTAWCQ
jgi:hypothetical protein